jgi:hypothetical protein
MSYQVKILCVSFSFIKLDYMIFSRIFLVSKIGMLEYMLVMSEEASQMSAFRGISFRSWIKCVVFLILNTDGRRIIG